MTQTIVNLGTGGAVLNGQNGSTGGADSNDALFLDWTGLDYVYLPGVAGNSLSVPDAAALDITGDIDIRVQVAMDDWTPASFSGLVSKWSSGQQSYYLLLNTSGGLQLSWTANGTSELNATSTVAVGVPDRSIKWVRATLDVNNGASGRDIKFFTSDDGVTWAQLGSTVTQAGVTSIFSGTSVAGVGDPNFVGVPLAAKIYRAQIFNGINGTKVLDVDTSVITSGAATSFPALTGQTVTINRGTAGRKTVAVVSPVWLFGTDDYMEVADNALLNIGATESFTALVAIRQWSTPLNFGRYLSRFNASTQRGYLLGSNGTSVEGEGAIGDGAGTVVTTPSGTSGSLAIMSLVLNRSTNTLQASLNGNFGTSASAGAVGSLSLSSVFRIGFEAPGGGAFFQDFEMLAVAVFRRALTATEISRITAYYQARLS